MILVSVCCGAISSAYDEDQGYCPKCGLPTEFVSEDDEFDEAEQDYPRQPKYTKPEYNIFGKIEED